MRSMFWNQHIWRLDKWTQVAMSPHCFSFNVSSLQIFSFMLHLVMLKTCANLWKFARAQEVAETYVDVIRRLDTHHKNMCTYQFFPGSGLTSRSWRMMPKIQTFNKFSHVCSRHFSPVIGALHGSNYLRMMVLQLAFHQTHANHHWRRGWNDAGFNNNICVFIPIDQVGLGTPFSNIKWVPATKWVCTPQLLVSTKRLHAPSNALMLNVLLERACNPFCRKGIFAIGMFEQKPQPIL